MSDKSKISNNILKDYNDKINGEKTKLLIVFLCLIVLFVASLYWSLVTGSVELSQKDIFGAIQSYISGNIDKTNEMNIMVINEIRLPRIILSFIIGASLSITGAAMQGLFRNPLADPALIGVSTGAALGAVIFIVLGSIILPNLPQDFSLYIQPIAAFVGGIISTIIAYKLASRSGMTNISILLLAGIAVNAMNGAIYGFFVFIANDAQLRNITFWSLGSFSGSNWTSVSISIFAVLIPSLFLLKYGKVLNIISLGEKEAYYLGVNLQHIKRVIIFIAAVSIGGGVSQAGIIGFLGLVTPHIIRLWFTHNYKYLLPLSMLFGGTLLMIADTLARTIVSPAELPIGILTTGLGGPFFIWLLLREKKSEELM